MEILEKLLQFLESIIQKVWSAEPSFYTKVAAMVIIVVFVLTYVSNHYLRWKAFVWNKKKGNCLFEIEDTIAGFEIKVVPLNKERSRCSCKAKTRLGRKICAIKRMKKKK